MPLHTAASAASTTGTIARLTNRLAKKKGEQTGAVLRFEKLPPKAQLEGDFEVSMKAHGYVCVYNHYWHHENIHLSINLSKGVPAYIVDHSDWRSFEPYWKCILKPKLKSNFPGPGIPNELYTPRK